MIRIPPPPARWEAIDTPGDVLHLLTTQMSPSVQVALQAANTMLEGPEELRFLSTSAFLLHAASAADHFYPSPSRERRLKGRLAATFPNRALDMRILLDLEDNPIPLPAGTLGNLDRIRNDLVHIDERIEEWSLEGSPRLSFWGAGPTYPGPEAYMYFHLPDAALYSVGRVILVREVMAWLEEIKNRLRQISMPLMVVFEELGRPWPMAEEEAEEPSPEPVAGAEKGSEGL